MADFVVGGMKWTGGIDDGLDFEAVAWPKLLRAAVFLYTKILQELNRPNPGVRRLRVRATASRAAGGTYTAYTTPSKPGEPPRKRTGNLQANIKMVSDDAAKTIAFGVTANARYGLWLELGTTRMKPRPWLQATFDKYLPQVRAIAGLSAPGGGGKP